jgi:hypothetical protein
MMDDNYHDLVNNESKLLDTHDSFYPNKNKPESVASQRVKSELESEPNNTLSYIDHLANKTPQPASFEPTPPQDVYQFRRFVQK